MSEEREEQAGDTWDDSGEDSLGDDDTKPGSVGHVS